MVSGVLVAMSALLVASAPKEKRAMPPPVPEELAKAVEGTWQLGATYRITLRRDGPGLTVHEEAEVRPGRQVAYDEPVQYDAAERLLRFEGAGGIHRSVVLLRAANGGLEYSFQTELKPGQWMHGTWEKADRIEPAPGG